MFLLSIKTVSLRSRYMGYNSSYHHGNKQCPKHSPASGNVPDMPSAGPARILFLSELRGEIERAAASNFIMGSNRALCLQHYSSRHLFFGNYEMERLCVLKIARSKDQADWHHRVGTAHRFDSCNLLVRDGMDRAANPGLDECRFSRVERLLNPSPRIVRGYRPLYRIGRIYRVCRIDDLIRDDVDGKLGA